jgi:hypothetical protein
MQAITRRTKPVAFQPFELTVSITTREEFNDMISLFSYYTDIPNVTHTKDTEMHKRMTLICMSIYDALEAEDQY